MLRPDQRKYAGLVVTINRLLRSFRPTISPTAHSTVDQTILRWHKTFRRR